MTCNAGRGTPRPDVERQLGEAFEAGVCCARHCPPDECGGGLVGSNWVIEQSRGAIQVKDEQVGDRLKGYHQLISANIS